MAAEPQQGFFQDLWARRPGVIVAVVLLIVLLVCLACIALSVAVWQTVQGNDRPAVGEPTPFPEGITVVGRDPLIVGMSESETISVTLDLPTTLRLGGETYAVQSQAVTADGLWSPQVADEQTAVWVYGTIINYIVGLPASSANRTLLTQLNPGDEIHLTTGSGFDFTFTVDGRRLVPVSDRQIFAQNRPGITLLLLGDQTDGADQRLVVEGSYVVNESTAAGAADVVELGETVQLGDLQITVTGATYMPDRPEVPSGFCLLSG
jgi:hypothetical protein